MTEPDPLDALLREWKSPEPPAGFDERVAAAYRAASGTNRWKPFWKARVSIPVPVLFAAVIVLALIFWFRSASAPSAASPATGVVTRLNATGFQPLPNGEARVIPVKETQP